MMAKHTAGPWMVMPSDALAFGTERLGSLGFIHAPHPEGNQYEADLALAEANARLIAAVPELLAACRAVLADLTHPDTDDTIRRGPHVAILRAAIAKAEESANA